MSQERLIKRYTNRKLYDTQQSRYVTLDDIAKLVREGDDVRVIDNDSSEDLTSVTFAQIILEEEKRKSGLISVPFLRGLIRSGEAAVQDITDAASRGIEAIGELTERAVEGSNKAVDESRGFIDDMFRLPQRRLDALRESARKSVDKIRASEPVQSEVARLEKTIRGLEDMVAKLRTADEEQEAAAAAVHTNGAAEASTATPEAAAAAGQPTTPPTVETKVAQTPPVPPAADRDPRP